MPEGASVVVADYDLEGAKKACQTLNDAGGNAVAVYFNAAELESSRDLAAHTLKNFGRIDVVVNNAGYADPKRDADLLHADLDYSTNRLDDGQRRRRDRQRRVDRRVDRQPDGRYYGICKAGSVNFTRYVATQYGKAGVRCNCVAPGLVLTPAAERSLTDEYKELFIAHNAVDYAGQSEDIAGVIAFLASDDARYVTGQTVVADGGCTCHNPTVRDMRAFAEGQTTFK
ncbi:unnamed protein product [Mycena citricolor]|uniref:3-oxoacyl-[acyl-carrier-protein] reductase n=1 Tax=Mycena citricolor TaxID=2018698 RepID=A0AAD2HFR9_9AGAR|nr:unnamed protein product [Mycena citricolor]